MKRFYRAIVVALACLFALVPVSAQASSSQVSTTVGGGCRLPGGAWVRTSANWNGNQLTYVVANSPTPLLIAGSPRSYAAYVDSGGTGRTTNLYYDRGSWIYRGDVYRSTSAVTLILYGDGTRCSSTIYR